MTLRAKLFWPLYFDKLKPSTSQYCSNLFFGPQLIFAPFNFAVLFGSQNKGHANVKGFTVVVQQKQCPVCECLVQQITRVSCDDVKPAIWVDIGNWRWSLIWDSAPEQVSKSVSEYMYIIVIKQTRHNTVLACQFTQINFPVDITQC